MEWNGAEWKKNVGITKKRYPILEEPMMGSQWKAREPMGSISKQTSISNFEDFGLLSPN
jgi:hypothetical protein